MSARETVMNEEHGGMMEKHATDFWEKATQEYETVEAEKARERDAKQQQWRRTHHTKERELLEAAYPGIPLEGSVDEGWHVVFEGHQLAITKAPPLMPQPYEDQHPQYRRWVVSVQGGKGAVCTEGDGRAGLVKACKAAIHEHENSTCPRVGGA